MLEVIWQILAVALVFTVVVGFHELGHFLLARRYGMDVDEFAVGFGPKLFSRKSKRGTVFAFRMIPLGGFVRVKGSEPKADGGEVLIPGGFFSQGPWRRGVVFLAGPIFSLLLGVLMFFAVSFVYGVPGKEPVIGDVLAGTPAQKGGLLPGDRVVSIDGRRVESYQAMREMVRPSKGELSFVVARGGLEQTLKITPEQKLQKLTDGDGALMYDDSGKPISKVMGYMGAAPESVLFQFGDSMRGAIRDSVTVVTETAKVLVNWRRLKEEAGGPITIVQTTTEVAKSGLRPLIFLAGLISLSLGLLNLLPIPLLDGGQIVVALIEGLRGGKRLSLRVQEVVATVGIGLLLLIMVSVMALDIGRLTNPKPKPAPESGK